MPRDNAEDLIERIEHQLDSGYAGGALDLASYAVRCHRDDPDLWALYAEALEANGRVPDAVRAYTRAVELSPDWVAGLARRASLLIELGQVDEARADVDAAMEQDPEIAEAQFNRAILAEIDGNDVEAARAYRTAEMLDPGRYYLPQRTSAERFDEALAQARDDLPDRLRALLADVPFVVRGMPERVDDAWEAGPNPLVFAWVTGPDIPEGEDAPEPWSVTPESIVIYKKNLERVCASPEDLLQELTITLFHEVLAYLRLPDEALDDE